MFKNSTHVESLQQVVAMLVAVSVLVWSVGFYGNAQAANLVEISNTLTDSDISATSNHQIEFTTPATGPGVAASSTITVTFPTTPDSFNLTGLNETNVTLTIGGSPATIAATPSGATWGAAFAGDVLTITSGTGVVATNTLVEIVITNVGNPATGGSYEFYVTAGAEDTGRTRVVILDSVTVTASVPTLFEFTVTGLTASTSVNGTSTTGSTTATTIPFGDLFAGEIKTLAQQLNVQTNARNGYVVTVEQDSDLISETGAIIDSFADATYINEPAAWLSPTNQLLDDQTWGHWGLTSSDGDLFAGAQPTLEFGEDEWIAASTTPRIVMAHTGSADNASGTPSALQDDIGQTIVGFQIEITPLQEAADDYETILTYIATPTF